MNKIPLSYWRLVNHCINSVDFDFEVNLDRKTLLEWSKNVYLVFDNCEYVLASVLEDFNNAFIGLYSDETASQLLVYLLQHRKEVSNGKN